MGSKVGKLDGCEVGDDVGKKITDEFIEGEALGFKDGCMVGFKVDGTGLGAVEGKTEGAQVGENVGCADGTGVGRIVGKNVGNIVGSAEGGFDTPDAKFNPHILVSSGDANTTLEAEPPTIFAVANAIEFCTDGLFAASSGI